MRQKTTLAALAAIMGLVMFSCQKQQNPVQDTVSNDVLAAISQAGFSTLDVLKVDGGYVVEGDIFITDDHLRAKAGWSTITIAQTEQYQTYNTVTAPSSGQRTITVSVSSKLPSSYVVATDSAIQRYNDQKLRLAFARVSSGADIAITPAPKSAQYLASAGFPTATGDPYNSILVSTRQIGTQPVQTVASILAHEMGHCIGFRHTDWMNRSFSCGGAATNEGAGTVGAVQIPGTPSGPDAYSWMLSCIGSGQSRPFNANDVIALNYLY